MYSRLAELENEDAIRDRLLDNAANQLLKAAEWGGTSRETLEDDLSVSDLQCLAKSRLHEAKVRSARAKFATAWEKPRSSPRY